MKPRTATLVMIVLGVVVGLAVIDSRMTAATNAKERTRLQSVKLGMAESDVVRLMGREPFKMAPNSSRSEIVVGDRSTLIGSIRSWGQPFFGKSIILEGGRVVDIREFIVFR